MSTLPTVLVGIALFMQFRTVRVKVKDGTRQYGQLVQSYRREPDGMPTHRVCGSLGVVTDAQAAIFRAAFAAARTETPVQVLDPGALDKLQTVALWSRDWLDVAACLQAWQDSGLRNLVRDLFAGHQEEVDPADVVAALVVQRLVAPDSKLAACQWFGDTALPELLTIAPSRFHNTRVHRVLERLEAADADLQCAFADLMLRAGGQPCLAMFLDCTDTWFTGQGPDLAERGKTKEGFYREKIAILLLCRHDGMPLRFKVLRGNAEDGGAMLDQLSELSRTGWLPAAPVVVDRALGNTSDLLQMIDLDVTFVTALVASEHKAYGAVWDCPALLQLDPTDKASVDRAGAAAQAAGMTRHGDTLYVLERSVSQRDADERAAMAQALSPASEQAPRRGDDLALDMLQQARRYKAAVTDGKVVSMAAVQRGIGRSNGHMSRIMAMLKLPPDVLAAIHAGDARNLTKNAIVDLCKGRDPELKRNAFAQACADARPKVRSDRPASPRANDTHQPWLQVAIAFNPVMWRSKRLAADEREQRVRDKVAQINERLCAPTRAWTLTRATAAVSVLLSRAAMTQMYATEQLELLPGRPTLVLVRDEARWQAQRARDGVQVIASSPRLDTAAVDRVRLYRSKDGVEKDFRTIKSVLELRPVWHRSDNKVRAHVTLCVLALAVERWMDSQLRRASRNETATRALAVLRNVRLIGLQLPGATGVIPQPNAATAEQRELAAALGVGWALGGATASRRVTTVR